MKGCIEIENLCKNYGKIEAVKDLSLVVREGEFFGFIGPNGAGKSTTIRMLLGLLSPTEGSATVLGYPLSQSKKYLEQVGYLPSEPQFYHDMSVQEQIKYSMKLRHLDCQKEVDVLCERLELDTKKKIEELSLGNRKKVGIVCAMMHKPKLYIMDEPTSGLDPLMQKVFFELLHERQKEGATIFFSSHVLSEVQNHCTRAAIIRRGKLAAVDYIDNLSKTNAKKITLQGVTQLPAGLNVKSVEKSEQGISFLYQGEIKILINELNQLPVTDMTIVEPDLEEIFMHYYVKED